MSPKPKLVLKKKPRTPFEELVHERLAVTRELAKYDSVKFLKLTPQAFLREAMEIARMDGARLKKLREALESGKPELENAGKALRIMTAAWRSPNWSGPPRDLRRLNYLLNAPALAELAAAHATSFELAAVAAQIAGEKYPDDFGTAESTQATQKKLLELALRRDELDQQIEKAWSAEDVSYSDDFKATFRISNGKVSLGPKVAERLIPHLLQHQQEA